MQVLPGAAGPFHGLHADRDAAERLRQVVEAGQVHLGEVVDLLPGDLLDGGDRGRLACLVGLQVTLVAAHRGVHGLAERLGVGEAVGLVDLARRLAVVRLGVGDPVVAGDGEADRLLPAVEDVDQDQRVGGLAADAQVVDAVDAARVHRGEQAGGQRVPLVVGPAFQAHDQDVLRADRWGPDRGRCRCRVRCDRLTKWYAYTGHREQHRGDRAAHRVSDLARDQRTAAHAEQSCSPPADLVPLVARLPAQSTHGMPYGAFGLTVTAAPSGPLVAVADAVGDCDGVPVPASSDADTDRGPRSRRASRWRRDVAVAFARRARPTPTGQPLRRKPGSTGLPMPRAYLDGSPASAPDRTRRGPGALSMWC